VSAFATLDDYTVRTGQSALSTAQAARITALLDDASALIRSQLPTGYEPDADLAKAVVVTMVIRAATNPGGRRSRTVGGVSETYDQDGGLYLADGELEALLSGWDEGGSGAYTVGLRDDAFPPCPTLPYHPPYRYRDRRERYGRRW
jgi:hypothetical protein